MWNIHSYGSREGYVRNIIPRDEWITLEDITEKVEVSSRRVLAFIHRNIERDYYYEAWIKFDDGWKRCFTRRTNVIPVVNRRPRK